MKANRKRKPNQRHRFLSYSKAFVLFMFVLFSTSMTFAQQSATVRGTITDAVTGTPLPGVSIVVKGTSKGVSTDFDGNYVIEASPREMLTYSYVGYKTVDILIGSQRIINVRLEEEVSNLDEVVVVGYGTQRKSDLTGAVAVVAVDDAKKTVTYDVAKMLQGQVAGVTVQSSGEPGGFVNMKIRGVSSFNNNNPLFVIDGMIVDSPYDFAPGDIESIQVLKDASSAAIYGVRGANGVVIITTKSGKGGRQAIRYRGLFGFQNVAKKWSLTNREQYQQITNQAYINAGEAILPGNDPSSPYFISNVDTNWQDAAFRTGIVLNHTVSLQGGTAELGYNLNLDYFKNSSYIDVPQDYERLSGTLNVNGVKGKFKYGAKVGITQSDKNSFNEYNAGTSSIIH
ncbi:MAG: carboxypeptidase-like regulatory domain-containing protein, partial [Capnocytophaga sp.]|nr:carboxypeptidase-like regulatory domain-containing protein [Capnocytophaga sp.]